MNFENAPGRFPYQTPVVPRSSKQKQASGLNSAWTVEEHKLFLAGLEKFGKGPRSSIWEDLSIYVGSKTQKQVLLHAHAYFFKLLRSSELLVGASTLSEIEKLEWEEGEQNVFEQFLDHYDENVPDRWERVAVAFPNRSVQDVQKYYMKLIMGMALEKEKTTVQNERHEPSDELYTESDENPDAHLSFASFPSPINFPLP